MEIKTVPENKGENENLEKAIEIVNIKNKEIAELFGVKANDDLKVSYYHSTGVLSSKIFSQEREFMGYVDGSDEILLIHPDAANGLFTDLFKEMEVITKYALVKYYLCKKYYPKREDFKLYHKYVSDALALIVSGKFQDQVAKFEFKMYTPGKKLKKETELQLLFYIIKEFSGLDYLFKHLDEIMNDLDIKKTLPKIYNKTFDELILPLKEKTIEEERKLRELEKAKRQSQFNETKNAQRPGNTPGKFISRDKFKSKINAEPNNQKSRFTYSKKPQNNSNQNKSIEPKNKTNVQKNKYSNSKKLDQ